MYKKLVKRFENLPIEEKLRYANTYYDYLYANIEQYLKITDLDYLYLEIRNDSEIEDEKLDRPEVRFDEFQYLGEMGMMGMDGEDDYNTFRDDEFLTELLYDLGINYPHWLNKIIHNKREGDKFILSNVGLEEEDLMDFFRIINATI